MPEPPLPGDLVTVLVKPNPAVIATLRRDGHPVTVATWYLWERDRVLVNMDEGRARLGHLRVDPRVSITVLDDATWHNHISLQGRVVELAHDEDLGIIDRISRHYLGREYPDRTRRRVSAWIEIDRWHAWGAFAHPPRV